MSDATKPNIKTTADATKQKAERWTLIGKPFQDYSFWKVERLRVGVSARDVIDAGNLVATDQRVKKIVEIYSELRITAHRVIRSVPPRGRLFTKVVEAEVSDADLILTWLQPGG